MSVVFTDIFFFVRGEKEPHNKSKKTKGKRKKERSYWFFLFFSFLFFFFCDGSVRFLFPLLFFFPFAVFSAPGLLSPFLSLFHPCLSPLFLLLLLLLFLLLPFLPISFSLSFSLFLELERIQKGLQKIGQIPIFFHGRLIENDKNGRYFAYFFDILVIILISFFVYFLLTWFCNNSIFEYFYGCLRKILMLISLSLCPYIVPLSSSFIECPPCKTETLGMGDGKGRGGRRRGKGGRRRGEGGPAGGKKCV